MKPVLRVIVAGFGVAAMLKAHALAASSLVTAFTGHLPAHYASAAQPVIFILGAVAVGLIALLGGR